MLLVHSGHGSMMVSALELRGEGKVKNEPLFDDIVVRDMNKLNMDVRFSFSFFQCDFQTKLRTLLFMSDDDHAVTKTFLSGLIFHEIPNTSRVSVNSQVPSNTRACVYVDQ